jgi:transposase
MDTIRSDPWAVAGESRRLDVVDLGHRRRFSDDFKLAVVAESYGAGAVVTQVARRYGVRPGQIYHWRTLAQADLARGMAPTSAPAFVPVIAAPEAAAFVAPYARSAATPLVIVMAGGRRVEVLPGFDAATLGLLVTALEGLP